MKVSVIFLILAACIVALVMSIIIYVVSESISSETLEEWNSFQVCLESIKYRLLCNCESSL